MESETRPATQPACTDFNLVSFNLRAYAEQVFEEYMFTKAFVAATFVSIGQQVYVPRSVLEDTTELRSEYASLEVGPIHPMMRNKCIHLNVYERLPNRFTNSSVRLDPLRLEPLPDPAEVARMRPKRFFRLFNGCLSQFNEWRECFHRLLASHHFKKVPQLENYYFFWPHGSPIIRFQNVDDVSGECSGC